MRILTFTTLFPNVAKPSHGIFVETRLKHLLGTGQIEAKVVAPIPWFPFKNRHFGRYAAWANAPANEMRSGIKVIYPRYPVIPKFGMTIAPWLLTQSSKPVIGRLIDEGYAFDLIDAHYFYPDGVAAAMLGKYFNKPVVITARGSDISLIPQYCLPRRQIIWAANQAKGLITVCNALREELVSLGVDCKKIITLRNGVDLNLFKPVDRNATRTSLGLTGFTLLSVGNLVPVKAHELTISALPLLPDARLLIAGVGPERANLEALTRRLNVADRVSFLGSLTQQDLRLYYGTADALILASSREGWANVLLESMACGTPVIASKVWGTPEVVASPEAGLLLPERTPMAIATAVKTLISKNIDRTATRIYAEQFSWKDTSFGQLQMFKKILENETSTSLIHKSNLSRTV